MRGIALAALALFASLGLSGCQAEDARAGAPDQPLAGVLQLDGARYPFTVTTCVAEGARAPRSFTLLGHGKTAQGGTFRVEASGSSNTVDAWFRHGGQRTVLYTSDFEPGQLRLVNGVVRGDGSARDTSNGARISASFSAACGAQATG